jgi:hypothetical protein
VASGSAPGWSPVRLRVLPGRAPGGGSALGQLQVGSGGLQGGSESALGGLRVVSGSAPGALRVCSGCFPAEWFQSGLSFRDMKATFPAFYPERLTCQISQIVIFGCQ